MPACAMTSLFSRLRLRRTGPCARALLCLLTFALCGCQFPFGKRAVAPEPVVAPEPACVVLALPASGPYAAIAAKIRRGATTAQQELTKAGGTLRLENINTEAPDWLTTLASRLLRCGGRAPARRGL